MTWRSFLLIILLAMQLHKHADELVKCVSIYFQLIETKSSFKTTYKYTMVYAIMQQAKPCKC